MPLAVELNLTMSTIVRLQFCLINVLRIHETSSPIHWCNKYRGCSRPSCQAENGPQVLVKAGPQRPKRRQRGAAVFRVPDSKIVH